MKTHITLLLILALAFGANAQTDSTDVTNEEFDQLIEKKEGKKEKAEKDTVRVRFGKHNVEITTKGKKTHIDVERLEDFEGQWDDEKWDGWDDITINGKDADKKKDMDGHWGGFDIGANLLLDTDYSIYPEGTDNFFELRPEKSLEFDWNLTEYTFGFGSYAGIVTGLGLSWNNYHFKNRITVSLDNNGVIWPEDLPQGDFRKSKLTTVYLTAPLMFEVQIPGNHGKDRLFLSAGVVGGLKIGEHTKYKVAGDKTKDKGDFNVSPFRWSYIGKVGFNDFGVFVKYYQTPLFQDGKGPADTPLTVGVSLDF